MDHADLQVFSVGVYGKNEPQFFRELSSAAIDCLVDVRLRRGMRGARYSFANSTRLQAGLSERGIAYRHEKLLAPAQNLRAIQKQADRDNETSKRARENLDGSFVDAYLAQISNFDFEDLFQCLGGLRRIAFFCVEAAPAACHRSLITAEIIRRYSIPVKHL